MKKIAVLLWIFLLFPSITWAQEKIEAPVWNVGDKWVFTQGNIEAVGADENSYILNFSEDTCLVENKGFKKIIFDKSTLNRNELPRRKQRGIKNFKFCHSALDAESSPVFWIPASAGMTNSPQAAGNTTRRDLCY